MAHPYASQAKASQKRRLSALGAKAGKSFGSSSMYKKSSYPAKGAGSSTPLTISGGTAKKRADRPSNKFAGGGFVGGGGGGTKKRKGRSTTNIIIASPGAGGGGGARPVPVPVPVNRPVPVPVAAGLPPRPPIAPPGAGGLPGAGGPPINVNVPPPAAAGPVGLPPPMPARPPGMAGGGLIGSTYHNWGKGFANGGSVKKKASGGPVVGRRPSDDDEDDEPSPNIGGAILESMGGSSGEGGLGGGSSPIGGDQNFKKGGAIKKRQMGGMAGNPGLGPQGLGPPGLQQRRRPVAPGAVPGAGPGVGPGMPGRRPPVVPLTGGRPTRPGYMKKGGKAHDDEAQDKKLIAKMIKKSKKADGGPVDDEDTMPQASGTSVSSSANASRSSMSGVMKALGGVGKAIGPSGGGGDAVRAAQGAQTAAERAGQAAAASTQSLGRSQNTGFKAAPVPGGAPGAGNKFQIAKDGGAIKKYKAGGDVTGAFSTRDQDKYGTSTFRGGKYEDEPTVVKERTKGFNQPMGQDVSEDVAAEKRTRGTHYNKGGAVKAGSHSGLGRLQKISAARKVPAKTEI